MAKVPVHFIGFLANVDSTLIGLKMGDGFAVEHRTGNDVAPFLEKVNKHYGLQTGFGFVIRSPICVTKADLAQMEGTPQGGVAIQPNVLDEAHRFVQDKCRLLRLFKEGNILLAYSFVYHLADADAEIKPFGFIREYPILDTEPFVLAPPEIVDAESFIKATSLSQLDKILQLALDSFDKSYETDDTGLAFLSLMIAMEVLLHPGDSGELRYRISRNAGVLLGQDPDAGEAIYKDVRSLYDKRSKLVHTGDRASATRKDVLKLRHYVRDAIKETLRADMSKDELLNTLNSCGFGERPWRKGN